MSSVKMPSDAELRLAEIADHGLDPVGPAPAFHQRVELVARAFAYEHVDVALALEQPLDEVAADEAGGARDEVGRQRSLLP
jgi:hypothetical protein